MIYFTSDTHFADVRVLRIDRRPFGSMTQHDAALILLWNETVSPGDEVWHLGDFTRGGPPGYAEELLAGLNGRKHLIIGNNDAAETLSAAGWARVRLSSPAGSRRSAAAETPAGASALSSQTRAGSERTATARRGR